jgi:hypothetical protein
MIGIGCIAGALSCMFYLVFGLVIGMSVGIARLV